MLIRVLGAFCAALFCVSTGLAGEPSLKDAETAWNSGDVATALAQWQALAQQGDIIAAMDSCAQPIIGAVNGFAITGGFEVALACDFLVASTEARFADTHARVGIIPGWGLSQKLSRLIGLGRAKELSLTGNYLSAEQAERWGLVNRVVAPAELLPTCRQLARDMLKDFPPAIQGQGGDSQTFFAALKCKDRGLSVRQIFEALRDVYNPRCAPPWPLTDLMEPSIAQLASQLAISKL